MASWLSCLSPTLSHLRGLGRKCLLNYSSLINSFLLLRIISADPTFTLRRIRGSSPNVNRLRKSFAKVVLRGLHILLYQLVFFPGRAFRRKYSRRARTSCPKRELNCSGGNTGWLINCSFMHRSEWDDERKGEKEEEKGKKERKRERE